ncbi:unnamed protein product [Brassica rapa]|uniref:Uncharacterized protein n=1 Tax=Brassica campestris TaxID=3711 RepID=A0A8D9DBJ8_BRACM|nr:unnamed protein product [Brassica rapa]
MCIDGQPSTSYVCLRTHTDTHRQPRTPTDVLCLLNRLPTWAKITQTVHGKGLRAESKDHCADMCTDGQPRTSCVPRGPKSPKQSTGMASVLSPRTTVLICVLTDSHRRPVCADGHTRTAMDVLCVLMDTHGHKHVLCVLNRQPTWAKITRTVHRKGQRAESKDQHADMCTDGQPQTSCVFSVLSPRTNVLICVLMDSHGRPVCADGHRQTRTDTHVQPQTQPKWAKITRTVHGKGQRAESKDQRADMCTDGQPRTSCSTGRVSVLSPRTNVLICVLMDSHRRPVCADGHTRTHTVTQGQPRTSCVLPTWSKITQTVHEKGQRAESKDQRADMCTDGQPRMPCVC